MSLTGGKRKANKSLKAWVTFVKKVQKEEKLSYKDAIHRAKVRKDKTKRTHAEWAETNNFTWYSEDTLPEEWKSGLQV